MIRWFFKLFYLFAVVTSIYILVQIFSGQIYTRTPPADLVSKNNISNVSESWPFKIELGMINYVCSTPSPNIDVDEESLISAWYLPPKTRLSPTMRAIGRCQMAAKRMASMGVGFDTSSCQCLSPWPVFVVVMMVSYLLCNVYRLVIGFPIDKESYTDPLNCFRRYSASVVSLVICFIAIAPIVYDHGQLDFGLIHTAYGQMYPESYYSTSAEWEALLLPMAVMYFVNAFECFVQLLFALLAKFNESGCAEKIESWIVPKTKILISIPGRVIESTKQYVVEKPKVIV